MTGGSVKACTECKQVKLRCDAKDTFPSSCSRCRKRKLQCNVDAAFRRTPARQRVREMAEELQRARESMRARETSEPIPSAADSRGQESPDTNYDPSVFFALNDPSSLPDTATLGSILLKREEIVDSFKTFCIHFYPHLPIVDVKMPLCAMLELCPFLFWTIIIVTRRITPLAASLQPRLTEEYNTLLRMEAFMVPLGLASIQALLYISTWPLPVAKQPEDPSWIYCGITLNASLYMGLNRPGDEQPLRSIGVVPGDLRTRGQTWLGHFWTSTLHSSFLGILPTIRSSSDLRNIEALLRAQDVPREFAAQVSIQQHVAKHTDLMCSLLDRTSSFDLVQIFEQEIQSVRERFSGCWTTRTEFNLLAARLRLYAMAIVQNARKLTMLPIESSFPQLPGATNLLLQMGLDVSCSIINTFSGDLVYSGNCMSESRSLQLSLPKTYFRELAFATTFLLKYFALNNTARTEDQQKARNQIATAYSHFKACSRDPTDEQGRVVAMIELLSRQKPCDRRAAEELRIKNRMGASILHDVVSTAAELRDIPVHALNSDDRPGHRRPPVQQADSARTEPNAAFGAATDAMDESAWDGIMDMLWSDHEWQIYGFGLEQNC